MEDRCAWSLVAIAATLMLACQTPATASSKLPLTWRDDAALHDVQFVGTHIGWAAGDHGALWQTTDAGQTWTLLETNTTASIRSICLLTDEVGWIAGWQIKESPELSTGLLIATRDGGRSWEELPTQGLSPLRYVKFFGLEEGIVVGEPTTENRTGVWSTLDGGKSWNPVEGPASSGWTSASLTSPEMGLLSDQAGNVLLLAGPQLMSSRLPPLKGRAIRSVGLSNEHQSWLVGDGGLVMHSESGGVVWESPQTPLPDGVRMISDFRTVALKESAVWIAGNPGGVIWHRPDQGRKWVAQSTGITTPLNKLHFVNDQFGCAVGDLGVILTTNDGGETWTTSRGENRHLALFTFQSRTTTVAPEMLAKVAGEQGFRSAVSVAIRPRETSGPLSSADRLDIAATQCGAATAELGWQLPLDAPGLELDGKRLLDNWQQRTDGKLPMTLLSRLVRQIRVWRPQVVIVEQPAPEDAAAGLILDAVLHAIDQAGDSTRFLDHRELGGLNPWKVERIYLQLLPGSLGEVAIEPFDVLPRWQTNVHMAAAASRKYLPSAWGTISRWNYRAVDGKGQPLPQSLGTDFFAGLSLSTSSATRRTLLPIEDGQLEPIIKAAQRQRNVLTFAEKSFDDPQAASQVLAQLKDVTAEMPPAQAAATMFELWQEYLNRSQWDSAEALAMEMLHRYPDQAITSEIAEWLLIYYVSEEVAFQRVQRMNASPKSKVEDTVPRSKSAIQQTAHQANFSGMMELKERLPKAAFVQRQLEDHWPQLTTTPTVQFPLAALHRGRGTSNFADLVYRKGLGNDEAEQRRAWSDVFRREIWLTQHDPEVPEGIISCFSTRSKPILDGVLSDDCWQDVREWTLSHRSTSDMPEDRLPMMMMAYDDEYLYLAASVPRLAGQSNDPPHLSGRTHDADLRRHDRLTFLLDTDRDYQTWYEFHVDQRGWTAESFWHGDQYDPQWFVAADGDETQWRIELAIPWGELTAKPPTPGTAWGFTVQRTAPTVGKHTWTPVSNATPAGASLGIVRFE